MGGNFTSTVAIINSGISLSGGAGRRNEEQEFVASIAYITGEPAGPPVVSPFYGRLVVKPDGLETTPFAD